MIPMENPFCWVSPIFRSAWTLRAHRSVVDAIKQFILKKFFTWYIGFF